MFLRAMVVMATLAPPAKVGGIITVVPDRITSDKITMDKITLGKITLYKITLDKITSHELV